MGIPGYTILDRDSVPPRSAPTDTSTLFAVGETEKGDTTPRLITSMAQFVLWYGKRMNFSILYDALDLFFHEGGGRCYVSRVLGPDPVAASVALEGADAADSLSVVANSPGEWGNSLRVTVVVDGATFGLVVSDLVGVLETSPQFTAPAEAAAWSESSSYVNVVVTGSVNPVATVNSALVGGTDDRANITDAEWLAALDSMPADLGPGQVAAPGRTTPEGHLQLRAHAAAKNRTAYLDGPNTGDVATLKSSATTAQAGSDILKETGFFGSWMLIPGLSPGTTRVAPGSAYAAGLTSRNDVTNGPNSAPAGVNGAGRWALGPVHSFTDEQYTELNSAGVNMVRSIYGEPRLYGFRSLAKEDTLWWQLTGGRLRMAIAARGGEIAERFVFAQIDGKGHSLSDFGGQLGGMLAEFYQSGALYGDTPSEAFRVEVGESVNTPESLALGIIKAVLAVRMSPFGEQVIIEIVRSPITTSIAA